MDNQNRPFISELDTLAFPAEHLFLDKETRLEDLQKMSWPVIAGRGCPNECIFCAAGQGVFGHKYRHRSAENIHKEIAILKEKFNVRSVFFYDDTFNQETRTDWFTELIVYSHDGAILFSKCEKNTVLNNGCNDAAAAEAIQSGKVQTRLFWITTKTELMIFAL